MAAIYNEDDNEPAAVSAPISDVPSSRCSTPLIEDSSSISSSSSKSVWMTTYKNVRRGYERSDSGISEDFHNDVQQQGSRKSSSSSSSSSSLISVIRSILGIHSAAEYSPTHPHCDHSIKSRCNSVPPLSSRRNWAQFSLPNELDPQKVETENNSVSQSSGIKRKESAPDISSVKDQGRRSNDPTMNNNPERPDKRKLESQRSHALVELISTEREYIKDLAMIVDGYIKFMKDPASRYPIPDDLKGRKEELVFANIESIYRWHRDVFVKALESCLENKQHFGSIFKKHENKLLMYANYCKNKTLSEYIVSKHSAYFEAIRIVLNQKLQLCDLLIKPVQRITKYKLMLSQICQFTTDEEEKASLREAEKIMEYILSTTNILMKSGCLEHLEGLIHLQGKLLHYGMFRCSQQNPLAKNGANGKIKEYLGLLFEQSITFSEQSGKEINPDYTFRYQFMLNKINLNDSIVNDDKNEWFLLISTDCQKTPLSLYCCATTAHERSTWINNIHKVMTGQNQLADRLVNPSGGCSETKSKNSIKKNRIKNNNNSLMRSVDKSNSTEDDFNGGNNSHTNNKNDDDTFAAIETTASVNVSASSDIDHPDIDDKVHKLTAMLETTL